MAVCLHVVALVGLGAVVVPFVWFMLAVDGLRSSTARPGPSGEALVRPLLPLLLIPQIALGLVLTARAEDRGGVFVREVALCALAAIVCFVPLTWLRS